MIREVSHLLFAWIGTPTAIILNMVNYLDLGNIMLIILSIIISILVIVYWSLKIICLKIEQKTKKIELNNYQSHE